MSFKEVEFSDGGNGIFLYNLQEDFSIELQHNTFKSLSYGLYIYNGDPEVKIFDSLYQDNSRGIHLRYDTASITVSSSSFMGNTVALEAYYSYFQYVSINSSHFSNNQKLFYLHLLRRRHSFVLDGNTFIENKAGFHVYDYRYIDQLQWIVKNNTFNGFSESLLNLYGQGQIISNVFRNNSFLLTPAIQIVAVDEEFLFCGNIIEGNWGTPALLDFTFSSHVVNISENIVQENNMSSVMWHLKCKPSYKIEDEVSFAGNILKGNIPSDDCFLPSVIYLEGQRNFRAQRNVLFNPMFLQEVRIIIPSLNRSLFLDFQNNYWGMSNILSRIDDNNQTRNSVPILFVPFYEDETLENSVTDHPENIPNENILMGRLQEHLHIRSGEIFDILSDFLIPPGIMLSMSPGSKLRIQENVSVYVEGSLIANGSADNQIEIITSAINVPQSCGVQLDHTDNSSGIVNILENGEFNPVCYTSWTYQNSKVTCRSLGFGPRMYAN